MQNVKTDFGYRMHLYQLLYQVSSFTQCFNCDLYQLLSIIMILMNAKVLRLQVYFLMIRVV